MGHTMTNDAHISYPRSEGERFAGEAKLTVVHCATCGVTYAIPASFYRSMRAYPGDTPNGWKTVCPFGHEWWYVGNETRAEKAEREARELSERLQAERDLRIDTERRLTAQRGATTRARNQRDRDRRRVAAGVCPCCNRSFQNLARHMAGQHPGYGPLGVHEDGPSATAG